MPPPMNIALTGGGTTLYLQPNRSSVRSLVVAQRNGGALAVPRSSVVAGRVAQRRREGRGASSPAISLAGARRSPEERGMEGIKLGTSTKI